jgi:hypothetical protein
MNFSSVPSDHAPLRLGEASSGRTFAVVALIGLPSMFQHDRHDRHGYQENYDTDDYLQDLPVLFLDLLAAD